MPMKPGPPRRTLQVLETPEIHARLRVVADREGVTVPSVVRDLIRSGLASRERQSVELFPAP